MVLCEIQLDNIGEEKTDNRVGQQLFVKHGDEMLQVSAGLDVVHGVSSVNLMVSFGFRVVA